MKIYKFKDLRNSADHPHFLQIIKDNEIWCAAPGSLNDENEFQFSFDYEPSKDTPELLAAVIEKYGQSKFPPNVVADYALRNDTLEYVMEPIIADVISQCRKSIGVTSFSTVGNDDRLWSEYGGHGYGVRIEFDLSDQSVGKTFHLVDYVSKRTFHIDVLLRSQITNCEEIYRKILCTKTKKWEDEQEIRFIGRKPDVGFVLDAPIVGVTFGARVPSDNLDRFSRICRQKGIDVSSVFLLQR